MSIETMLDASKQRKTDTEIIAAFKADGFKVTNTVSYKNQRGFMAESLTATNTVTKKPKTVYYLEGSSYQMGYLMGLMAEPEIETMATKFIDGIIPSIIGLPLDELEWLWPFVTGLLGDFVEHFAKEDIPETMMQEFEGICDACKASSAKTEVSLKKLLTINMGFDFLLSIVFDPESLFHKELEKRGISPEHIKLPAFCNGFAAFGEATVDGKHYLGRDFMFETADVFQDVACMVLYNPSDSLQLLGESKTRQPLLAMTAPGFVGSIAALNSKGVGMGVDVLPAACNNPKRPGINSLMLVRHTVDYAGSVEDAFNIIKDAQRGVSWLYIIADADSERAVVIEAGMKTDTLEPLSYVEESVKKYLPIQEFIDMYGQQAQEGLYVRWNDYQYPEEFLGYNANLFEHFGKTLTPEMMTETGFINKNYSNKCQKPDADVDNNPKAFYFAPQRENKKDMVLTTNIAITPSMRLCGMNFFTMLIVGKELGNFQWRYDELNSQLLETYGSIDDKNAWDLITFLSPFNKFPNYYGCGVSTDKYAEIQVGGSTSLLNLTDRKMKSLYGYYGDEAVELSLLAYI